MGVSSFHRWLIQKYPKVAVDAKEDKPSFLHGVLRPIDASKANPNGVEFHNLYIDLNGIIHACFHADDELVPPRSFDDVFKNIFDYIDRIFSIVRPRRLLYIAVDGVAPRAKMNHQRARRFKTAKEAVISESVEELLRWEFASEGKRVLPKLPPELSDSNVITPGTEFMDALSTALEYYVHLRLNCDPGWKRIKVIISSAYVPGEGEHKIMQFIRLQRNLPGYDPNTRHCVYGSDADLIMLALATHEVHFCILREDMVGQGKQPNLLFGRIDAVYGSTALCSKTYQFLNIWRLREYLETDLTISCPPFVMDFERIIDDFIFISFFTGNDFIPSLPSIEVHEGGVDLLMTVYKEEFKNFGGYLTNVNKIKENTMGIELKRVEHFILAVGSYEDRIFQKRSMLRQRQLERVMRENFDGMYTDGRNYLPEYSMFKASSSTLLRSKFSYGNDSDFLHNIFLDSEVLQNTRDLKLKLKESIRQKSDLFKNNSLKDKIKLAEPGWKQRYYMEKFCAKGLVEIERIRSEIVRNYVEGLCWIFHYYFAGVCSWKWFYKFHYSPFASDFRGLSVSVVRFQMGEPLKPFVQLMGVLPPRSAHALPKAYRTLMTSARSPIIDFYPNDFEVDTDGKRYSWQGSAKLDFIDEDRLDLEMKKLGKELKEEEVRRNTLKSDKIFVRSCHGLGLTVAALYGCCNHSLGRACLAVKIDSIASGGMNGFILPCHEGSTAANFRSPIKGMSDVINDNVVFALYKDPVFHIHSPRPPANVKFPSKEITGGDIVWKPLWHEVEARHGFF